MVSNELELIYDNNEQMKCKQSIFFLDFHEYYKVGSYVSSEEGNEIS